MPLASLLHDRFVRLLAQQGGETMDWSGIGQLAAQDAAGGTSPAAPNAIYSKGAH
jgi:hypothetical protein